MSSKDNLGDRIKGYESLYKQKCMRGLPIVIRLDGKGFSKFTKRFARPFCPDLKSMMETVTEYLVDTTGALIGYTQSDEITLILYTDNPKGQLYFNGEVNKLNSVLASMASGVFTKEMLKLDDSFLEESTIVSFDCRTFVVPNKIEAANTLLWRYKDCLKNSVTQVAQEFFSHKELMGKSTKARREMLENIGNPWQNYAHEYKEGSFIKKGVGKLTGGVYYDQMSIDGKVEFIFGGDVDEQ